MMEYIKSGKVVSINNCNTCGKSLKMGWKFCPHCKNEIQRHTDKCFNCGNDIGADWNYCPICKSEVKIELMNRVRTDSCNEWLRDILKK